MFGQASPVQLHVENLLATAGSQLAQSGLPGAGPEPDKEALESLVPGQPADRPGKQSTFPFR